MLNVSIPQEEFELRPRITVVGVGGGGSNAVNNMIRTELQGVEFLVCNTDAQSLKMNLSERKIQLGTNVTRGLGAGARPEVGRAAAEEALDEIMGYLEGSNMVFITAGMGGGTGTGAAPIIARAAKEQGILTVGVVTKPFHFEGAHRMRLAEQGIEELQQHVDTLLIIPNQNLFRVANEKTTFADAFKMADEVLHSGVRGVTDLIVMPGLINLDFADIRAVMSEMGKAMMGTGEATGERRAVEAAEAAINNPLLEDASIQGARGLLINITGGMDMTLFEVDEACNRIRDEVDPDANIIFGSTFSPELEGKIRVSVVATGIDAGMRMRLPTGTTTATGAATGFAPEPAGKQPQPSFANIGGTGGFGRGVTLRSGQAATTQHQPSNAPSFMPQQRTGTTARSSFAARAAAATAPKATAPTYGWSQGRTATAAGLKVEEQFEPEIGAAEESMVAEPVAMMIEDMPSMTPGHTTASHTTAQRGERDGDSFIPPMPVMMEARPITATASAMAPMVPTAPASAEPVAAAPVASSAAPVAGHKPSLFDRMMGGGSKATAPAAAAPAPKAPPAPTATSVQLQSQPQPTLAVDNSDRIPAASSMDDDLDIPAFLRRQAS